MEGNNKSYVETHREPRPYADSVISTNEEIKTPRYAWVILIFTYLVSLAAPIGQFKLVSIPLYFIYVPGVSPAGGFQMDAAGYGMLMTMVSIVGIILAFPAAFICRKLGLKWTITISALGVIVGGLIPIMAGTNIPMMYVGRLIEGLGIGLVGVAAPTLITLWFPPKTRGFALGLWCTWVPVAISINSVVCPSLAAAFNWQGVFWYVIIFTAIALALFLITYRVPEGEGASYNVEGSFGECMKLLKNRNIWFLFVVFTVFIAGQTGIVNTYLPNFLQTSPDANPPGFGWDAQSASLGLAAVTTIGLISNPAGGAICSRLPHHLKRIIPMSVAIIYLFCFYFLFQTSSVVLLWVGIILMGICAGFGGGGLRPLAPTIMNQSAMAATMGMAVMQFGQCIGNCFSPVYGALIDAGYTYWDACLQTIVPMSVVMLILAFFIRPSKKSPVHDK
ncbi:MAG: CynX/NimT family MFS transporter [Coriobacteriales bacterium]|jgi:predicted MFS family arabinose efflux permease